MIRFRENGPLISLSLIISVAGFAPVMGLTPSAPVHQNCLSGHPVPLLKTRVAFVIPVLTATPYSLAPDGSFYGFYAKYRNYSSTTTGLDMLSTTISHGYSFNGGWGKSLPMYEFASSNKFRNCGFAVGKNVNFITDIDVANGSLFSANGTARYDSVVTSFEEYVTLAEYHQFREFVASGGRLVLMGGDNLMAKVSVSAGVETYISGHGWTNEGWRAVHDGVYGAWGKDDLNWIGGRFAYYGGSYAGAVVNTSNPIGKKIYDSFGGMVFRSYSGHEEGGLHNKTGSSTVAVFEGGDVPVAAYVHRYVRGFVVCACFFADDVILTDPSVQLFLVMSLTVGLSPQSPPQSGWAHGRDCQVLGACFRLT